VLRDVARVRLTRVLATDLWVIVTAIAAVVTIPLAVVLIRQSRKAREATERSQSGAARNKERNRAGEAKRRLDATQVTFRAKAYVPIVGATPDRAPIELRVEGGNVWVQSVLLTWHYHIKDTQHTVVVDAPVLGWGENVLPVLTQPGPRPCELDWASARPAVQAAIEWRLDVEWSLDRDGPRRVSYVMEGETAWQTTS
jgi:hypothetical protein